MILRIIIIAAVLIAVVLVFAAMKPSTFHLQRSITIKVPTEKTFPLVNDFHNWSAWEPRDKGDAGIQRTYSGPAAGAGTMSEWQGSGSTGKGRMLITESVPNSRVSVAVDFVKPFQAHNINVFTLEPVGDSTKVTWNFEGTNVFVLKLMSVFVTTDRIMGDHFETGLET
jgi:Polyketide cyclase / dehydrase and lipid transport